MRLRNNDILITEKRLLSRAEASSYIGRGITSAMILFDEIGAIRRFGRRVLIDRFVIDQFLNELSHTQAEETRGNI